MKKIIVAVLLLVSVVVANFVLYDKYVKETVVAANVIISSNEQFDETILNFEKRKEQLEKDNAVLSEKNNILELENQKLQQFIEPISKFKTGEIITFGKYPYAANGKEMPIEWIILDRKGSKALLISRYGLDYKQYNDKAKGKNIGWANSTIRKWLNGDFMNKAFSNKEKQSIVKTFVSTLEHDAYLTMYDELKCTTRYKNSYDYVFLPMLGMFSSELSPTPYANKLSGSRFFSPWSIDVYCNDDNYFLHTGSQIKYDPDTHWYMGRINNYAFVLPSMWIDLKKAFPDYPQQSLEQLLAAQPEPKTEIETAQENPAKEK